MNNVLRTRNKHIYLIDFDDTTIFTGAIPPNHDVIDTMTIGYYLSQWIKHGNLDVIISKLKLYHINYTADQALKLWMKPIAKL